MCLAAHNRSARLFSREISGIRLDDDDVKAKYLKLSLGRFGVLCNTPLTVQVVRQRTLQN